MMERKERKLYLVLLVIFAFIFVLGGCDDLELPCTSDKPYYMLCACNNLASSDSNEIFTDAYNPVHSIGPSKNFEHHSILCLTNGYASLVFPDYKSIKYSMVPKDLLNKISSDVTNSLNEDYTLYPTPSVRNQIKAWPLIVGNVPGWEPIIPLDGEDPLDNENIDDTRDVVAKNLFLLHENRKSQGNYLHIEDIGPVNAQLCSDGECATLNVGASIGGAAPIRCRPELENFFIEVRTELNQVPTELYGCINENENYAWRTKSQLLSTYDSDGDKVPSFFDCDDNDIDVYGDFTSHGADPPKRICGDGKANTCGIIDNEGDECDQYPVACENNCMEAGVKCDFLDIGSDGGMCCGDDPVQDFGQIRTEMGQERESLCLPDNGIFETEFDEPNFGYSKEDGRGIPGWGNGESEDDCNGEWCWIRADKAPITGVGGMSFPVITLRDVRNNIDEDFYDVVSNNNKWIECKSPGDNDVAEGLISGEDPEFYFDSLELANGFTCYDEGDRWSWAVCLDDADYESSKNSHIKKRKAGDGLFKLTPAVRDNKAIMDTSGYRDFLYKNGEISTSTDFDTFEFMFRYPTEFHAPAKLVLTFTDTEGNEMFSKKVLGNITNGANLKYGKWYHVETDIPPDLSGIGGITLTSLPTRNFIEVKNVYFSNGEEDSPLCSGQPNSGTCEGDDCDNWIDSVDEFTTDGTFFNGKLLCNQLYDSDLGEGDSGANGKAWLGGDVVDALGDSEYLHCCGDDPGEYYAGPVDKINDEKRGCWNSQVVSEGNTISSVQFEAVYNKKNFISRYGIDEFVYGLDVVDELFDCGDNFYSASCAGHISFSEEVSIIRDEIVVQGSVKDLAIILAILTNNNSFLVGFAQAGSGSDENDFTDGFYSNPSRLGLIDLIKTEIVDSLTTYTELLNGENTMTCNNFNELSAPTLCNNIEDTVLNSLVGLFSVQKIDRYTNLLNTALLDVCRDLTFPPEDTCSALEPSEEEKLNDLLINNINNEWPENTYTLEQADEWVTIGKVTLESDKGGSNPGTHLSFPNDLGYELPRLSFTSENGAELWFFGTSNIRSIDLLPADFEGEETFEIQVRLGSAWHTVITEELETIGTVAKPAQFEYPCTQVEGECIYPIPGQPVEASELGITGASGLGYYLKNPNPGLYDLFLVTGSQPEDELYIPGDGKFFLLTDLGVDVDQLNIKAKKVAQQILYHTQEDETTGEISKFYGCQAANYQSESLPDTFTDYLNQPSCDVKGEYSCSFGDSKDGTTIINQWSKSTLQEVGYQPVEQDIMPEELDLDLKPASEGEVLIEDRKIAARMTPGLNILPNANFKVKDIKDLLFWEVFENELKIASNIELDKINLVDASTSTGLIIEEELFEISLTANQVMRSDKISVLEGDTPLHLSDKNNCKARILLYDKEGNLNPNDEFQTTPITKPIPISTATSTPSYIVVEFSGCTVSKPILQVLDITPAPYNYREKYQGENYPRAATSCCPQDYCWNGFACVAPMTDSVMAEVPGNGQYYRCEEGQWRELPLLSDWNGEKQGFCQEQGQCFVLSSLSSDINENIIAREPTEDDDEEIKNFHSQQGQVKFPSCINPDEYILDNYCNDEDWTSRTRFLAENLMQDVGRSDFSLYCTNPYDALVEFGINGNNKENYIFGSLEPETIETGLLGADATTTDVIEQPTQNIRSGACYQVNRAAKDDGSDSDADRLIPKIQNNCVNSVCLLKHEDGKVVFSTTLNKPINDPDSFLRAFDLEPETCDSGTCLTGTEFQGELEHIPEINGLIYGKDGITRTFSLSYAMDKVLEFFDDFFSRDTTLTESVEFMEESQNFKDLYFLQHEGKKVKAVKENLPRDPEVGIARKSLIADYEGFDTPVCEFLDGDRLGDDFEVQLLQGEKIDCVIDRNTQRVEVLVTAGNKHALDNLWPQLTGKLRPELEG